MVRFGDSDAFIINDLDLKTKIIDYIFSIIDLSKYRYNMLENQQQLNFLKINEHYVWGATAMMMSELKEVLKNSFKTKCLILQFSNNNVNIFIIIINILNI